VAQPGEDLGGIGGRGGGGGVGGVGIGDGFCAVAGGYGSFVAGCGDFLWGDVRAGGSVRGSDDEHVQAGFWFEGFFSAFAGDGRGFGCAGFAVDGGAGGVLDIDAERGVERGITGRMRMIECG